MLLIGRATRLSRYVTGLDKIYTATARFGAVSDTLDAEGEITALDAPIPDETAIRSALPAFTGDLFQIPPMASALKHSGVRLYDLHRRGISVKREPRPVHIHALDLTGIINDEATFEISCTSGTYVRTLLHDLAASLGSGAYLTALRRHSVGHLALQGAPTPDELDPTTIRNRIIPLSAVVSHLPEVVVEAGAVRDGICHGRRMGASGVGGSFRVTCEEELLAVYGDEGDGSRAEVVLCAG